MLTKLPRHGSAQPANALTSLDDVAPTKLLVYQAFSDEAVYEWPDRFHEI